MTDHLEIGYEKLEAIRNYLDVIRMQDFFQGLLAGNIESFRMKYPQLPDEFWDEAWREPDYEEFLRDIIPIYDGYYTVEELGVLAEFFATEVGRKYVKTAPITETLTGIVVKRFNEDFKRKVLAAAGESE